MKNHMTQPWSEIQEHYAALDRPEMVAFIDSLASSPYASGLFAWTSHLTLSIAQTPVEYPYFGPRLTVLPLAHGFVELRYVDTHFEEKQWHRSVRIVDAFARLERFFNELNWFTFYQKVSGPERRETR